MPKIRKGSNATVVTIDKTSMKISGFELNDEVVVIAERGKITIMKVEYLK